MADMSLHFGLADNDDRTERYRKDPDVESVLAQMNDCISTAPPEESNSGRFPTIFVFGLPRSGTTLTYQLIAECLDVGFVDGIAARFWGNPVMGLALSRSIGFSRDRMLFESDYGKSLDVSGPHEFAYFWQRALGIKTIQDAARFDIGAGVDWGSLISRVRSMQAFEGRPFVFKTMFVANCLAEFNSRIDMPIFVYVQRDARQVALSILDARIAYYGNVDTWWATVTPDYPKGVPSWGPHQVAFQVRQLSERYETLLRHLPPERLVRLNYRDVCASPLAALESVRRALRDAHGWDTPLTAAPPGHFIEHQYSPPYSDLQSATLDAVDAEFDLK